MRLSKAEMAIARFAQVAKLEGKEYLLNSFPEATANWTELKTA